MQAATPINGTSLKRQSTDDRQSETTSEDDYEVIKYQHEDKIYVAPSPPADETDRAYSRAAEKEEMVVPEPIYTMVIKSPRLMRAVDQSLDGDQTAGPTSGEVLAELDKVIRQASSAEDDQEDEEEEEEERPEMKRDAGDGQTESPVMWEYKLPAPPTPFQDSNDSHLNQLEFASESNLSGHSSSMSTNSFQHSADQLESQEESIDYLQPVIEFVTKQEPVTVIELDRGVELMDETATEEQIGHLAQPKAVQVVEKVTQEEQVVVLETSDPQAKQYGIESTTDEPISLAETSVSLSSLPPIPNTLPPSDSEDDSIQSPDMRFSIATYKLRVSKDLSYEEKLRSGSPDGLPSNLTASVVGNKNSCSPIDSRL